MPAAAIQLESHDTDVRQPERVGRFLRLESIQGALVQERRQALDALEAMVFKLERLDRWRSTSGVDLDPYTRLLRRHLHAARREFGNHENAGMEECFLSTAYRFAQRLSELSREPTTVREPLATIEDVRVAVR